MSVLDEILRWSASVPSAWMRDALRRVVTQAEISEPDVEDLAALCKKPHGLSDTAADVQPLTNDHLPAAETAGPVSLAALTHVADVNALAPNETIRFGKAGLTVIYGDNGAGKSGYARILKRACRARGSNEPILANALSEQPAGPPTARVTVAIAGSENEHLWKDGSPGPADLGAVSVFDSAAAQVYIADKTEVRFRPFGLDVLDKLAGVCSRVRARLESERGLLQVQVGSWPELPKETQAGQFLARLSALTPHDQVDTLATLTADEQKELETLAEVLAVSRREDPAKKASDLKVKAARLRRLADEVKGLSASLGKESIGNVVVLRSEAAMSLQRAGEAARQLTAEVVLEGLASQAWRAMWEAARTYSERHAYAGHTFPHAGEGAKCVLCQQDLASVARARFTRFEAFVRGEAQKTAAAKQKVAGDAVRACTVGNPGERTKDALDDLTVLDPALSENVMQFLAAATDARASLLTADRSPTPLTLPPPIEALERLVASIDLRATEMAKAADPAGLKRSESRHAELEGRRVLAELRPQIHAEIDRRARLNAYETCIKDTDTRAATKLSTELTKKYVTDALTSAFGEELGRLGFKTLDLELRPAGAQRGVLYHQVFLTHATKAQLPKVVSEGEARCIALAAFLAEVRSAAHASAIVFDDPVSSLDHRWRTNVSNRLVEESKQRQVIVFTHEMVFLAALLHEAERQELAYATQMICRGADSLAGHVEPDLPWTGLPTKKRIAVLKQDWQAADKVFRLQGQKAYEPRVTRIYANLRKTWERAVEEVLLNDAVLRFRQGIETNRLKKIGDITAEDLKTIETGVTKSSKWEGGHDHAPAANEPPPEPAEVEKDIELLESWVAGVHQRRK